MKKLINLLRGKKPCIVYYIDDDTCLPIVTDDLHRAIDIVNEIDGDTRRISDFIEWH